MMALMTSDILKWSIQVVLDEVIKSIGVWCRDMVTSFGGNKLSGVDLGKEGGGMIPYIIMVQEFSTNLIFEEEDVVSFSPINGRNMGKI